MEPLHALCWAFVGKGSPRLVLLNGKSLMMPWVWYEKNYMWCVIGQHKCLSADVINDASVKFFTDLTLTVSWFNLCEVGNSAFNYRFFPVCSGLNGLRNEEVWRKGSAKQIKAWRMFSWWWGCEVTYWLCASTFKWSPTSTYYIGLGHQQHNVL